MDYKTKAFIVGSLGDYGLQRIVDYRGDIVGLKQYFETHGEIESIFIAGGLMFGAGFLYEKTKLPITNFNLFIYGGLLDVLFRYGKISKTLNETYYKNISPINSFIWGGLPMIFANILPI